MDELQSTAKVIKALSDESRLRIMALLDRKPDLCVCEIREIIGLSQPTISSHLKVLEGAGLVTHRKDGLWVNYSTSGELEEGMKIILHGTLQSISQSKLVRDDLKRLSKVDRDKICGTQRII